MEEKPVFDLQGFHAGEREVLREVYGAHVGRVERSVSRYCRGADAECVVHEVFLALMERQEIREQFTGGDMGAWLATMAGRRALDFLRRRRRWTLLDDPRSLEGKLEPVGEEETLLHLDQVRRLNEAMEQFTREVLPRCGEDLARVFEVRFRSWLGQTEAARELNIPRTTLIHREQRLLRRLGPFLKRFFRVDRT